MIEDAELLRRYAVERSQDAFAELVRRRVDLVYSVALRRVGGDVHLAEDVTQKVFADLARKAASLGGRPVLSGWLYRSTQFAASDVVRSERRRRAREQETSVMNELTSPAETPTDWDRVRPLLDQALAELGESDRDAVALRFFEGQPFAEVGRSLQLSEDTARKRVERALDKMAAILSRRGVTSTGTAVGLMLANQATFAVAPVGLASSVIASAFGVVVPSSATGPAATALAGSGWLSWMNPTSSTLRILGSVGALMLGTAVFQAYRAHRSAQELSAATQARDELQSKLADLERRVAAAERRTQAATEDNDRLRTAIETASLAGVVGKDASRIAFVIDTSGSMRDPKHGGLYSAVLAKIEEVLRSSPEPKFFQVFDGDGRYVMADTAQKWLPNNATSREAARAALGRYAQDTVSNPVPGIQRALDALDGARDPFSRLHIFILGDELNARERSDLLLAQIDELNPADAQGRRRVAISAVAFPTWRPFASVKPIATPSSDPQGRTVMRATTAAADVVRTTPPTTFLRFDRLMRTLANRHGGTFVTAADLNSP